MSDCCGGSPAPAPGMRRRSLLSAVALAPLGALLGPVAAAGAAEATRAAAGPQRVLPRRAWARDLPVPRDLDVERPGDVRFLLVHHSATPNEYGRDEVIDQLRMFHRLHTGSERNWPDIAYNFLVDRYGGVWEGRAGSLTAPVKSSATGGSQGYAQLACFIGDLSEDPPTPAARTSMLRLLAALADRYRVDTRPGATTSFVSRGSNRWPAGRTVTTATIAGHRDMTLTACPGDGVYRQVRELFPAEVTALRATSARAPSPPPPRRTPPSPPAPPRRATAVPSSRALNPIASPTPPPARTAPAAAPAPPGATRGGSTAALVIGATALAAAGAAGGLAAHHRPR